MSEKPPIGAVLRNDGHWSTQGLVGCWLFNEGGGKRLFNPFDSQANSLASTTVWKKGGLYFGGNQYGFTIPNYNLILNLPAQTYILTLLAGTLQNGGYKILGKYPLNLHTVTTNRLNVLGNTSGNGINIVTNESVPTSVISDIAFCVNKANVAIRNVYINGTVCTYSTNIGSGVLIDGGTSSIYAADYMTGPIFHCLKIYNRILSPQEISSLHENPYQMVQVRPNSTSILTRSLDPTKNCWRWT